MNEGALRLRVTRAEAAKILRTSYQNVRRLQRTGQLHSNPDRYGVHRFDRREVESLAKKRGMQIRPSGELAATVFAMFEQHRRFAEIVIATQQEPDVIRRLWSEYTAGFREAAEDVMTTVDSQQAHEEAMREIDAEFVRRRCAGEPATCDYEVDRRAVLGTSAVSGCSEWPLGPTSRSGRAPPTARR